MSKLEVKDLYVNVEGKEILNGINLIVELGKVHILMGPNGSGKSTLANTLMGNPKYKITKGEILLDGINITNLSVNERAKAGLFMSFQYPSEITGVTMSNFLRTAWNSLKDEKMGVLDFHRKLKSKMKDLGMNYNISKRYVNEGFSGGEKKRSEILQMAILEPRYAILDETDSGLDVNSIKIVGECLEKMRNPASSMLIITHYNRILRYITPDSVSIMIDGKIISTGGRELIEEIDKVGYERLREAVWGKVRY